MRVKADPTISAFIFFMFYVRLICEYIRHHAQWNIDTYITYTTGLNLLVV